MQRGDEGKGRFTEELAPLYDIAVRFNGGANAGHTIAMPDGRVLNLHQIPSGIPHPDLVNVIGNGVFLSPVKLCAEIQDVKSIGLEVEPDNFKVSRQAALTMPHHIFEDMIRECTEKSQGTTQTGNSQTASSRALREGFRVEDIKNNEAGLRQTGLELLEEQRARRQTMFGILRTNNPDLDMTKYGISEGEEDIDEQAEMDKFMDAALSLGRYTTDTVFYLNSELRKKGSARVLAEGAQAFLLDIDHGMWPFTTSSNTTIGGAITGTGISPQFFNFENGIIGGVKAVQSHVGEGTFVTEIHNPALLKRLRGDESAVDAEVGKTTGRQRRLGYLDMPQLRRAIMVNGVKRIFMSKVDWNNRHDAFIPVCTSYTLNGKNYRIAPDSDYKLRLCEPKYEFLRGYNQSISDIREFSDLPKTVQKFVEFVEEQTDLGLSEEPEITHIEKIGVGPERGQIITR
jgi:adenylosuccinate synthase